MSVGESIEQTRQLVLERTRADTSFVVATHENPDGDALGSLIGMHGLLTALGKDSLMFIPAGELPLPVEYRFFTLDRVIEAPPAAADSGQTAPRHRLYNVGNAQPVEVTALLDLLEKVIGKPARRELLPMRPIDVLETFADSSELRRATGLRSSKGLASVYRGA